jgi:hypothetical protein
MITVIKIYLSTPKPLRKHLIKSMKAFAVGVKHYKDDERFSLY